MSDRIECVVTASADGQLRVQNLCQWARRRHWTPAKASSQIMRAAESMGPDAIPAVNLATMLNTGTRIELTWILELNDVSAFVLASGV